MRRLVVSLAVLVALLATADYGLRLYSQSVVAGELRSSLSLTEKPSVSFGGWPFVTHVLSGDFPSVSVAGNSLSTHGVVARDVKLTLDDVHFPRRRLLSGGGGTIRAGSGHGTVAMTGSDLTATLRHTGAPFTVRIAGGRASASAQGITVGLALKLSGDSMVLTPAATTIGPASVALPAIIPGLRYTSLRIQGSQAVLSVALRHPAFVVPG